MNNLMFKKLCILLIFSNLMLRNKNHISMHTLKANFDKIPINFIYILRVTSLNQ